MHMSSSLETADLTLEELGGRAGKTQRAGHAEVRPILVNNFESWPPIDRQGARAGGRPNTNTATCTPFYL